MSAAMKHFVLGSVKQVWTTRYQEKHFRARWVQPDEKREPQRQSGEKGGKVEKEPVFRKGDVWMMVKAGAFLEIVPVEKMAERVYDDWAKAKSTGTSQEDFEKQFSGKYEGGRNDDVEFLVRVIEQMITPPKRREKKANEKEEKEDENEEEKKEEEEGPPMNPIPSPTPAATGPSTTTTIPAAKRPRNRNFGKEKEKEQVIAPMNPILLEGKEKDAAKRKRLDEEEPRGRPKRSKGEKKARLQPPPDSEDEDDDSIEVIESWHKKTSKKGGYVWEKLIERTLPNGEKQRERKTNHTHKMTDGMHNYHGSRRFPKYNRWGNTKSGGR